MPSTSQRTPPRGRASSGKNCSSSGSFGSSCKPSGSRFPCSVLHICHDLSYIFKINNNKLNLCNNILSFRIIYKTLYNTKRELITGFNYTDCGLISKNDFDYIISRDDLIINISNVMINNHNDAIEDILELVEKEDGFEDLT